MSAILAVPVVIPTVLAVAQRAEKAAPCTVLEGKAFLRKDALRVLHRYLQISMLLGRSPCLLGNVVFRGRVTSHQIPSFEDGIIFLFDVEKALKQIDRLSRTVVAHIALEDYTPTEAALLTGESRRTIHRVYGAALDRLAEVFEQYALIDRPVENLSSPLGATPKSQDDITNDLEATNLVEIWH